MPDSSVKVEGPIDDKMLCYALLEQARDAVKDYCDSLRPKIVPASGEDIMALTGPRRVQ